MKFLTSPRPIGNVEVQRFNDFPLPVIYLFFRSSSITSGLHGFSVSCSSLFRSLSILQYIPSIFLGRSFQFSNDLQLHRNLFTFMSIVKCTFTSILYFPFTLHVQYQIHTYISMYFSLLHISFSTHYISFVLKLYKTIPEAFERKKCNNDCSNSVHFKNHRNIMDH